MSALLNLSVLFYFEDIFSKILYFVILKRVISNPQKTTKLVKDPTTGIFAGLKCDTPGAWGPDFI